MCKLEDYKKEFVDFTFKNGALKIGEFKLKSGRISPYFFNMGEFSDGEAIMKIGEFYAAKIMDNYKPEDYDIIFGPAYKGIPLAVATAIALKNKFDVNKDYTFNRKEPKKHGEGTKEEFQKNWLVGAKIKEGSKILILDDVFTIGDTKYETINLLNKAADNVKYIGLVIAMDRQETGVDGKNAIAEFTKKTGVPVDPIVNIIETKDYLRSIDKITDSDVNNIVEYVKKCGTDEAKKLLG